MDINQIKNDPESYRLLASRVQLTRSGNGYVGLCPFHSDNRQSLSVHKKEGVWLVNCHAGCKIGKGADSYAGNVVQFISKFHDIPFKEALQKANNELSGSWGAEKAHVDRAFQSALPDKTYKTLPMEHYALAEKRLEESEAALEFLKSRAITLETAKKLHIGFKQDIGKVAGATNADIEDKGWLVFPCFDGGQVVSIKYRSIVRKAFCRQPGFRTSLFNADAVDLFEPVVCCEGEMDVAALTQSGFRAVSLASASTMPTADELDKIAAASQIYLAGDNDEPGQKAMDRLLKVLPSAKKIQWEGGKDANDVLLKRCQGNTDVFRKEFTGLLNQASISPMPGVVDAVEGLKHATLCKSENDPARLRFPWKKVDEFGVLLPGSIVTLYATQTGCGKTTFCNQTAVYNARTRGDVILNYQAELPIASMYKMLTAHVLGKDRNNLDLGDGPLAAEKMKGLRYYIGRDTSLTTHEEALDLIEKAVKHLGITVVILDHFHAFNASGNKSTIECQKEAMRRLERMAHEYGLFVFVICQPRKSDQQHERKKQVNISAIQGTESITSTAHLVLGLHRDVDEKSKLDPKTEIHRIKAREEDKAEAYTELLLDGKTCSFFEISHDEPPAQSEFFSSPS